MGRTESSLPSNTPHLIHSVPHKVPFSPLQLSSVCLTVNNYPRIVYVQLQARFKLRPGACVRITNESAFSDKIVMQAHKTSRNTAVTFLSETHLRPGESVSAAPRPPPSLRPPLAALSRAPMSLWILSCPEEQSCRQARRRQRCS